jgi:aldehyde:ferredoxin oxidoreductase
MRWLNDCYQEGVVGDDIGLPLSKIGNMDFFTTLVDKITSREGFGDTLAEGTVRASIALGDDAVRLANRHTTRTGFHSNVYSARFFIAHAILFATESTNNIARLHEVAFSMMRWTMWMASEGTLSTVDTDVIRKMAKRFWGDEQAADFSTYAGKAQAAKLIQDRGFAKENLVACDFLYPLMLGHRQNDIIGDPTLESRLLSSVTGIDFSEEAYNETGERSFNLQRAIHAVEGYRTGRTDDVLSETEFESPLDREDGYFSIFNPDSLLPGADGEIVSRKGKVIEHDKFEAMMDEYYELRHWDVKSGLQKEETLRSLDLSDIISDLKKKKLVVS